MLYEDVDLEEEPLVIKEENAKRVGLAMSGAS
jgi:hypothetical protein